MRRLENRKKYRDLKKSSSYCHEEDPKITQKIFMFLLLSHKILLSQVHTILSAATPHLPTVNTNKFFFPYPSDPQRLIVQNHE